jgi:8-oxo-dGTP diphosphatase
MANVSDDDHPLSPAEFDSIYSRVPRLTVEVVLRNDRGAVFLVKRAIPPCAGQWHLPGGTVRFGEPLLHAVRRIARREIGVDVVQARDNGFIEYPSHYLNGLDCPVGIVFEATRYTGEASVNHEGRDGGWFSRLPAGMHADQDTYLVERGYLAG